MLREVEGGAAIASVARAHGISEQTISRRREKYAGMQSSEPKQVVARQALEIDAYIGVAEGKW